MKESSSAFRSAARAISLNAALTLTLALTIVTFCTVVGLVAAHMVDAGVIPPDFYDNPLITVGGILVGSVALTAVVSACMQHAFIRPLKRMTAAMNELARGNFDVRMEPRGRTRVQEIEEFARSFNTAAQELSGTELMRSNFISDFSHEFRTPINSLSGFAQLVRDGGLSFEERDEYLQIIVDESERLSGLSERILALSKMEAVSIVPDVEQVDVAEQIRRAVLLAESKRSGKNIRIDLALDECRVPGNAGYLAQLWTNLLDNAIKFSPDDASVSVALYGGRQGEEGRASAADEAVCWISDEGCGMDPETRKHLFDKFYQGDTSHASEGSGLGLALCKKIVDLHRGTIAVHSTQGAGTVFEVRLPLVAGA